MKWMMFLEPQSPPVKDGWKMEMVISKHFLCKDMMKIIQLIANYFFQWLAARGSRYIGISIKVFSYPRLNNGSQRPLFLAHLMGDRLIPVMNSPLI